MGINDNDSDMQRTKLECQFRVDASIMVIDAFNQGYLLGQQYAEQLFNKE